MSIIFNSNIKIELAENFKTATSSVVILSAFLTTAALKWLRSCLEPAVKVTIVTRWKLQDLTNGASELSAYEFAQENGWEFMINTNMHHKIYVIDQNYAFIGSANFTRRGMHLNLKGNDESSCKVKLEELDKKEIDKYISMCCTIDDELHAEMQKILEGVEKEELKQQQTQWPNNLLRKLQEQKLSVLWVDDLLFHSPYTMQESNDTDRIDHDLNLLGLTDSSSINDIPSVFTGLQNTVLWDWLLALLNREENGSLKFGALTENMHNAVCDFPKPSRREIKGFVANLYDWVRYCEPHSVGIRQPNHTEILFLKDVSSTY